VPQIEQVRWGSVLMNLTVLRIRAKYRLDGNARCSGDRTLTPPARRVKVRRQRTMVASHKEFRVSPTISGESKFRNKIPETLETGCLYNGMKSLTSDHDDELQLGALRNPNRERETNARKKIIIGDGSFCIHGLDAGRHGRNAWRERDRNQDR
jgi:hypothetical protein